MLNDDEVEELRSLQARAYGREASLTPADARRLRELEDRRRIQDAVPAQELLSPSDAGVAVSADADAGADAGADAERPRGTEADADDGTGSEVEAEATETPDASTETLPSLRRLLQAHWRPATVAVVVLLAIGVGVGWLAFGRADAAPVALTEEQQGWQDDIVSSGVYDPGSVRALAVENGVVAWAATKDARERTCLILGAEDAIVPSCERTENVVETGVYGSIMTMLDDDVQRQVNVQMLLAASGEPAVAVSSYDYEPGESGITYANERESQTAERLAAEGYDVGSLWVVGYDGDVPVWSAIDLESQNPCLIYDGATDDAPVTCADPTTMQEQSSGLVLNVVDADTGAVTHLELQSNQGPSYLVITRDGEISGAGGD